FLSTKNIKIANARMLIAEQIVVHEGVALILEIPHNGLVAKPKTKRRIAIAITNISKFFGFSRNLRYKTAVITPIIVIDELEALPRPKERIKCLKGLVNAGESSSTAELKNTKNIKKANKITSRPLPNKVIDAQAK